MKLTKGPANKNKYNLFVRPSYAWIKHTHWSRERNRQSVFSLKTDPMKCLSNTGWDLTSLFIKTAPRVPGLYIDSTYLHSATAAFDDVVSLSFLRNPDHETLCFKSQFSVRTAPLNEVFRISLNIKFNLEFAFCFLESNALLNDKILICLELKMDRYLLNCRCLTSVFWERIIWRSCERS